MTESDKKKDILFTVTMSAAEAEALELLSKQYDLNKGKTLLKCLKLATLVQEEAEKQARAMRWMRQILTEK